MYDDNNDEYLLVICNSITITMMNISQNRKNDEEILVIFVDNTDCNSNPKMNTTNLYRINQEFWLKGASQTSLMTIIYLTVAEFQSRARKESILNL